MENEIKLDEQNANPKIVFTAGKPPHSEEILRLEKGKFFYKGKEIEDINKIYERFSEWMDLAEEDKGKL